MSLLAFQLFKVFCNFVILVFQLRLSIIFLSFPKYKPRHFTGPSVQVISLFRFGGLFFPKWLIKVPFHNAILFGWILELQKLCQNLDPWPSQLLPKTLQINQEKMWNDPWNILVFHIWESEISKCAEVLCTWLQDLFFWFYWMIILWNHEKSKTRNDLTLVFHV